MTLKELLAKQQAIVDAAKAAHRDLTEEEQRSFDEYQAQIDALQPGGEPDGTAARAAAAERTRITNITAMCRDFGLDAEPYIRDAAMTEDKCRHSRAPQGGRRSQARR